MELKVLVACEESQEVCKAFRALGHEAYSCDIQPCSGGHPEWHIQGDVLEHIRNHAEEYDMVLAFPPCTHLAISGARWFRDKVREQKEAIEFFMAFVNAPIEKICIENPVGIMSTKYRKPNQYVQPYEYGHPSRKKTGLWLKNLPDLKPTKIVEPELYTDKRGRTYSKDFLFDENGKWMPFKGQGGRRSVTYKGIAEAMAEQWGNIPITSQPKDILGGCL